MTALAPDALSEPRLSLRSRSNPSLVPLPFAGLAEFTERAGPWCSGDHTSWNKSHRVFDPAQKRTFVCGLSFPPWIMEKDDDPRHDYGGDRRPDDVCDARVRSGLGRQAHQRGGKEAGEEIGAHFHHYRTWFAESEKPVDSF